VRKYTDYKGVRSRGRPKKTETKVVGKDYQADSTTKQGRC